MTRDRKSRKGHSLDLKNVGGDAYVVMSRGHHDPALFCAALRASSVFCDWPLGPPEHEWWKATPMDGGVRYSAVAREIRGAFPVTVAREAARMVGGGAGMIAAPEHPALAGVGTPGPWKCNGQVLHRHFLDAVVRQVADSGRAGKTSWDLWKSFGYLLGPTVYGAIRRLSQWRVIGYDRQSRVWRIVGACCMCGATDARCRGSITLRCSKCHDALGRVIRTALG